jgi:molybdopterin molybdotransferase
MRPFTSTITLDEARARLLAVVRPIERVELSPLAEAHGRVLARDLVAPFDVPPFDRSAMDGYAVRAADTAGATRSDPKVLRLVGRSYTAEPFRGVLEPGDCIEIATGAPLPASADAVVMVEDTGRPGSGDWPAPAWLESEQTVLVLTETRAGQHIVSRGADMRSGDLLAGNGALLTPSRIGALAAVGLDRVSVYARPLVAILPTGNEVVPPGRRLPEASVYDVNSFTLGALVDRHGGAPMRFAPVRDTIEDVRAALDAVQNLPGATSAPEEFAADIVVFAGGSSVGERDVIIDGIRERGEILFHGIAVKPGKPTLLATIGRQIVLGMPGNPTSCLSNAHVLLVPALRAAGRLPALAFERRTCRLASTVRSPRDRHQFLPVRIDGEVATPVFKGSGEITSLSRADGYVEIELGVEEIAEGSSVVVTLY